jgi:hypothetical protein
MPTTESKRVFARSHARELTSEELALVSGGDTPPDSWCYGLTQGGGDIAVVPSDDVIVQG